MNGHTERVAILALAVTAAVALLTAMALHADSPALAGQLVVAAVSALSALAVIASRP